MINQNKPLGRRDFLNKGLLMGLSATALASLWRNAGAAELSKWQPPGLQLYTLRTAMADDPLETLKKVAALGYKNLEGYTTDKGSFYGYGAKEFATICSDLGMQYISCHIPYGEEAKGTLYTKAANFNYRWEKCLADLAEANVKYAVVPNLPNHVRKPLDAALEMCDLLNTNGEIAKKFGIQLGYHNHAFEFDPLEKETLLELMLRKTQRELVVFELDLYWAVKAGHEPLKWFAKHKGRFQMWHVKDMDKVTKDTAEVGNGTIDFKAIFNASELSGMKYWFVEQDRTVQAPILAVEQSINYLNQNILKTKN